jgi:hypothetical protein
MLLANVNNITVKPLVAAAGLLLLGVGLGLLLARVLK